jgi:hypothetical protein
MLARAEAASEFAARFAGKPARCNTTFNQKQKFGVEFAVCKWREEMRLTKRAISGNGFSKATFGVAAILLAFAPPRSGGAAEATPGFRFCQGYFALCAASTCTPTGRHIAVNTLNGSTRNFPEADCTCPVILGTSIANLSGGNMKGSCEPPPEGGKIWSTYQPRPDIPQALTNWIPHLPEDAAPPQVCPGNGNKPYAQYVQCFSFSCDMESYINNVPVVTCHCAIGATLAGLPAPPQSSFPTQAGQGDRAICTELPVGNVVQIPSP